MKLVIVESPTKAKTIGKFISKDYKVESSFGHVRDLPSSNMGIDIENDFEPKYLVTAKAKKNVAKLKELAAKAESVILATDEDREGEAIAWHLVSALNLEKKRAGRIVFHEITKDAILEALKKPRGLDMGLVDAQQARRVLDRLVGYELSPFLWKKVARGLSAGRVQSVAVRLIVEREREIKAFTPEEYWSIEPELAKQGAGASEADAALSFRARLSKIDGQGVDKMAVKNKAEADKITNDLDRAVYAVANVEKKQVKRNAPRPFTTSLLQQTANRWLGYSARQTMTVAQQLYEQGYITYMRTDSQFLSEKFLKDAHAYLLSKYGKEYALAKPRRFKTRSKNAQEAHEAIRPTEAGTEPEALKDKLERNQYKLYKLIWQRSVASQMPEAVFDATALDIDAQGTAYQFRATGQTLDFDGFLRIYPEKATEIELPRVNVGEALDLVRLHKEEHFTKPPARYSDAGLVKALERYGIGRPSTYAPTIATIIARNYVVRDEGKKLAPTDIAFVVVDLLVGHFSHIIDYEFTARLEGELDRVAEGEKNWRPVIRDFYIPFHANLEEKAKELKKSDIMPEEKSDVKCDKCGAPMVVKTGRYGKFLACSAFPNCRNIKGMNGNGGPAEDDPALKELKEKHAGEKCDKCGAPMAVKTGRYGPFLACTAYPKCKNIKNIREGGAGNEATGIACPACGRGQIVVKRGRRGPFYACDRYPDCKTAFSGKPTGQKCPDCGAPLMEAKNGVKCSNKECGYKAK